MPRGGRRSGRPGQSYPNRLDLQSQPVRTAPSREYGQGVAQQRAQQAVPLPQATPTAPLPAGASPGSVPPPDPGMLAAPTARPGEPVTAGLPIGAGPGPSALATGNPDDQVLVNLYQAYRNAPTEGLRALIEQMEMQGRV